MPNGPTIFILRYYYLLPRAKRDVSSPPTKYFVRRSVQNTAAGTRDIPTSEKRTAHTTHTTHRSTGVFRSIVWRSGNIFWERKNCYISVFTPKITCNIPYRYRCQVEQGVRHQSNEEKGNSKRHTEKLYITDRDRYSFRPTTEKWESSTQNPRTNHLFPHPSDKKRKDDDK